MTAQRQVGAQVLGCRQASSRRLVVERWVLDRCCLSARWTARPRPRPDLLPSGAPSRCSAAPCRCRRTCDATPVVKRRPPDGDHARRPNPPKPQIAPRPRPPIRTRLQPNQMHPSPFPPHQGTIGVLRDEGFTSVAQACALPSSAPGSSRPPPHVPIRTPAPHQHRDGKPTLPSRTYLHRSGPPPRPQP